jgi:hypothetical protein
MFVGPVAVLVSRAVVREVVDRVLVGRVILVAWEVLRVEVDVGAAAAGWHWE